MTRSRRRGRPRLEPEATRPSERIAQNRIALSTAPGLSAEGHAVARLPDGRVVFIEGAAPNERVEIEITQAASRFCRARALRILEPSAARVEPVCSHFGVCGGCTLQHVSASVVTAAKVSSFLDALQRIGRVDVETIAVDPPWNGPAYGYRTRARFAFAPGPVVGFRRASGREVVDVESCPILAPALDRALSALRAVVKEEAAGEAEAVASGAQTLVQIPRITPRLVSTEVEIVDAGSDRALLVEDGQGELLVAPGVFAQSNPEGNAALVDYVASLVPERTPEVIELYAGSGNLTRALAPRATRVHAIEGSAPAVALARKVQAPNVELENAPVEEALGRVRQRPTMMVVNPPRPGISAEAAARIRALAPAGFIYVSCNPATFARDVERMGLVLGRIRLFDLYPQTPHAELVALFTAG